MSASHNLSQSGATPASTSSQSTSTPHFSIDLNALPATSGLGAVVPLTTGAGTGTGQARKPSTNTLAHSVPAAGGERPAKFGDLSFGSENSTTSPSAAARTSPPPQSSMAMALGRSSSPFSGAGSPHRALRTGSPRHLSPATSQIFERDVQEDVLAPELSSAVPHHFQTENHIPPILDAASTAITDKHLSPEDLEIVMSSAHQPAAVTVGGASPEELPASAFASHSDLGANHEHLDANSTYGNVNPSDLRRLSFISFADVVHAEHAQKDEETLHSMGLSSAAPSLHGNRSPSPMRSQVGSHLPPPSAPSRDRSGSVSAQGELTIETLRHALDKTGIERSGSVSHQHPLSLSTRVDE